MLVYLIYKLINPCYNFDRTTYLYTHRAETPLDLFFLQITFKLELILIKSCK